MSDLHHSERHSLQSFVLSSQLLVDSKFQHSELTLPCQPLPGRHPGRNGLARSRGCGRMQAHSGNWIGTILSAFPAETWGLAQLLLDMSLWTQRMGGGPLLLHLQPCCWTEGSAGMRTRQKGHEGGTGPILASPGATPDPHQRPRGSPRLAQRSQKTLEASSEGPGLASACRTDLACSLSYCRRNSKSSPTWDPLSLCAAGLVYQHMYQVHSQGDGQWNGCLGGSIIRHTVADVLSTTGGP